MKKRALITGITGQDGSYLAELLLEKNYEVYGLIRRSSLEKLDRIEHIKDEINFLQGDLHDQPSIDKAFEVSQPDECYNLAAQSFVKTSFDQPFYTADATALGVLRVIDALNRIKKDCRFYQASSSEMFGKVQETPQKETTKFHPRSPYGVCKVYGYWATVNYREAYDLFACNGILFNHETIASFMPMFCREKGDSCFDIKPICEVVEFDRDKECYQSKDVLGLQVWDKDGWVDVTYASAYPHNVAEDNKKPRYINSRSGAVMATGSHVAFMKGSEEKKFEDIEVGDSMEIIDLPCREIEGEDEVSDEEAKLMGMMVGDGSFTCDNKGIGIHGRFSNSSKEVRSEFDFLWNKVTGGYTNYYPTKSGFNPENIVGQLSLVGGNDWLQELDMYNRDGKKRIPQVILNSIKRTMLIFLEGYNLADGLKENSCTYEFRNFKTNSATLAMGLWYLINCTTQQDINLTLDVKDDGRLFYSLNILSPDSRLDKENKVKDLLDKDLSQREISRRTNISRNFIRKIQNGGHCCEIHHLRKDLIEVKKIVDLPSYEGWFYDLETSSGTFHCGVGRCHVHNSPRRGLEFVTKKITDGVAKIVAGKDSELVLGDLEARRDWGHSRDYVKAMWLMLQQDVPDDYVVATNETHSIREFCEAAFSLVDLDYKAYVKQDERFMRPAEVNLLLGDNTKAKTVLGWEPKMKFRDLVKDMLKADLGRYGVWDADELLLYSDEKED